MDVQNLLDIAADVCMRAHTGQRDKAGKAYFLHPMRIAMRCKTDEERIVALLHDTIEDSDVTPEYLLDLGFSQEIVDAVLSVTKQDGESYEDFVSRAKKNPLGRTVKILDLEDNLNASRLDSFSPEMADRYQKYLCALNFLQTEEPKPSMEEQKTRSIKDLYTALRQEENYKIQYRGKSTGGTNYMRDRLIIRDKDKTVINESSIFETLCKIGNIVGFTTLANSRVVASKGKFNYALVKGNTASNYYRLHQGWYVLADIPVVSVAVALNEFFEHTEAKLIASVVDR